MLRYVRTMLALCVLMVVMGCTPAQVPPAAELNPTVTPQAQAQLPPTATPTQTPPTLTPVPPTATPAPPTPTATPEPITEALPIIRFNTDKPYVAITVDDFFTFTNYRDRAAIDLLETANELNAALTLCPTGYALEAYKIVVPDQLTTIRQLIDAGDYEICNHTLSHPHLPELSLDEQREELSAAAELIEQHWGRSPGPFFRPTWGVWNEDTRRAAAEAGFPYLVNWTIDTGDWEGEEPPSIDTIMAHVRCAQAGDIILMHANRRRSAEALPLMIEHLRANGLEPVTLSTLLEHGEPVLMENPTDLKEVRYCG